MNDVITGVEWTIFRRMRPTRRVGLIVVACALLSLATVVWLAQSGQQQLPFRETLAGNSADHWRAFGGTWDIWKGSLRNESSERGAKLVTGSPAWTDYSMDADMELLGPGDAGLIVRVSDAEAGVDAYTGYYVGVRSLNSSFFIGRARHNWQEYPAAIMATKVKPFSWYHLRVTVVGCSIEAEATARSTGESKVLRFSADECYPRGQVGLRSYSSGGVWRNIAVTPADLHRASGPALAHFEKLPALDGIPPARNILGSYVRSMDAEDTASVLDRGAPVQSISSLRLLPSGFKEAVAVRGVVILSTPGLYVQDSTGGLSVLHPQGPPLKVGDEVEVQGEVAFTGIRSVMQDATVRLLWEGGPPPPYAVTLNQAAAGSYDSTFVEVEALLTGKHKSDDGKLTLSMEGRSQAFSAILNPGRSAALFPSLSVGSTLRLRGICVADTRYTHDREPFALLVRSVEDVQIVAGPPWWSWYFLLRVLLVFALMGLGAYVLYLRVRTWRMGAVLEERSRLAHEIHDTLAQSFAGIGYQLQAIRNRLPAGDDLLREQVEVACSLVRHSHEETRRSIATLRDEAQGPAAMAEHLNECVHRMVGGGNLSVEVATRGAAFALPLRIESALLRIGQEASANAVSHSGASRLQIQIQYGKDSVMLRVADNGAGFRPDQETNGFGLAGIRRRAASIGAEITINSSEGRGTTIQVRVPLSRRNTWRDWFALRVHSSVLADVNGRRG